MLYCRSHKIRVQLCQEFNIMPIGRFKLLNGNTVISDAGNMDITDEYTIFDCISKINSFHHEYIYCGKFVAQDFCKLINKPLPPLFDPLKHEVGSISHKHTNSNDSSSTWNPTRKQLYDCVLLMICYFGNPSKLPILCTIKYKLECKTELKSNPTYLIKSVNTYLKKSGVTFQNIIDSLSKNNNIRNFEYDLLLNYLHEKNIDQYFY